MKSRLYSTRSSAVRAARAECRQIFGQFYSAYEGPDYIIHPGTEAERLNSWKYSDYAGPSRYELTCKIAGKPSHD